MFKSVHLAWLLAAASLAGLPAHAETPLQQQLSLPMTVEYDSNPALLSAEAKAVWRARLAPNYTLSRESGPDVFNAGLGLALEKSSDAAVSGNRADPSLSLGWKHLSPREEMGLSARYEKASSRTTELLESGLVHSDSSRTAATLAGNWSHAVSERAGLSLDGNYGDYRYSGGAGLTDYTTTAGGATLNYAWNERTDPFVRLGATHYSPQGTPQGAATASNQTSGVIGVKWRPTERLDWAFQGGINRTTGPSSSNGWQGGATVHYAGERVDLALDAGHTVGATGIGGFEAANQVVGHCSYALSEKSNAGVDLSLRDNQGSVPNTTRQINLWTTRELTPFWGLRLGYQYKQLDNNGVGNANAYVVGLTLTYTNPNL